MNDREWDKLFELIAKAVEMPGMTAVQKGQKIRSEAKERGQELYLDEFIGECSE